jgi:3-hydroxyisobutyrate dehydrogenase-like beta-hydroxyacid dehydrogenase
MATVAFIGLGNMGGNMVRHLIAAGHQLRVFARRPETMAPYVALGAIATDSPAQAAQGAQFVFTNVTATADVEAILLGDAEERHGVIETAAPGTIICDFSTIDATATRAIAAQLAEREIEFMDCPVSGGTKAAEAGTLTIMVGGTEDNLVKVRPLLEKLGSNIFHMGAVGDGQVTKACNQIVQVVAIQGIAEALLYAEVNDVDLHKVVNALMSGFAGSKMLGLMGPKMASRDFAAGIEARLHYKDFGLVADAAAKQQLPMPATALVHKQLSKLMEAGWGNMDTCNLLRVLEHDMEA